MMKKLLFTLLVLSSILLSDSKNDIINIANISFQDMYWSNDYSTTYEDVLYSRQMVAEQTIDRKAVILYFFDLHIC